MKDIDTIIKNALGAEPSDPSFLHHLAPLTDAMLEKNSNPNGGALFSPPEWVAMMCEHYDPFMVSICMAFIIGKVYSSPMTIMMINTVREFTFVTIEAILSGFRNEEVTPGEFLDFLGV